MMEDKTLNEYISFVTKNDGTASKRGSTGNGQEPSYMNSNISYDTFMNLFKSILANQSDYFRAVYWNQEKSINYETLVLNVGLNYKISSFT